MSDREDLEVTVRYGEQPIDNRVAPVGADMLPDVPVTLAARRVPGGFQVEGPNGPISVSRGTSADIVHGAIALRVGVVKRFRLPRWIFAQSDIVFPVLILASSLLALQINLFMQLLAGGGGGGGAVPEPSPEYIARLLEGDYQGADRGVIAEHSDRPQGGAEIKSFYLQPGSAGPTDRIGGAKTVGARHQDGDPNAKENASYSEPLEELGATDRPDDPQDDVVAEAQDPGLDEETEDKAVEVNEGWGLNDWYDTEDARKDAGEIQKQLDRSRQVLRIDPDDPYALSIRAYYEYLAMDQTAARKTYQHILKLYPEDSAAWNNVALTYKRDGDYKTEEEDYRISLLYGPEEPNTLNNLAVCVAHQGRYEEALAIMEQLETLSPDDPYAELYRAQIYAMMGKEEEAYRHLRNSLADMRKLDTLHNIEYQQDIRVDPAFEEMRKQDRFRKLLLRYYGDRPGGWWTLPGILP